MCLSFFLSPFSLSFGSSQEKILRRLICLPLKGLGCQQIGVGQGGRKEEIAAIIICPTFLLKSKLQSKENQLASKEGQLATWKVATCFLMFALLISVGGIGYLTVEKIGYRDKRKGTILIVVNII